VTGKTKAVRGLRVLQCVFESILMNKRNDSGDKGGDGEEVGEAGGSWGPCSVERWGRTVRFEY
jgi:hypothetical protein